MKRKFILKLIDKYNLATKSRVESHCYKRYYIYYLLSKTGMSLSSIGRALGKGHATVIHGIKEHKKWHKLQDERYMDTIKTLIEEMQCFDNEMHIIPVKIKKRGVCYDFTFTLEVDKEFANSFGDSTTLNEIVTKFMEINLVEKLKYIV
jgi:hypothetical protein